MMRKTCLCGVLTTAITAALPVFADDAMELASLSRSDFLAEYESRYANGVEIQKEMLVRLSPELEDAYDTGPVTPEETAGFACLYDTMDEAGELQALAKQILSYDIMRDRIESDPEFDIVTMMFDDEFQTAFTNDISDEVFAAMSDCELVSLGSRRFDMSPEVWAVIGQAAEERGYQ